MNTGIAIGLAGVALMIGAGGSWLWMNGPSLVSEHAKQDQVVKQDHQPFGPVPNVTVLATEVKPAPAAPAPAPVAEPQVETPAPIVHRARPKHKKRPKSVAKLSSDWGQRPSQPQPQVPFSLERFLNVR